MENLRINKAYEKFTVDVDGEVIDVVIDCRDETINELTDSILKCKARVKKMKEELEQAKTTKAINKLNKEIAALITPMIVRSITQETYDKILNACGGGVFTLEPKDVNVVMMPIFANIADALTIRSLSIKKYEHYLGDLNGAKDSRDVSHLSLP